MGRNRGGHLRRRDRPLIALLDTGVTRTRLPRRQVVPGRNFSGEGPRGDTEDRDGHGTAVARAILAACPGARILPIKIFCNRGYLRNQRVLLRALAWLNRNRQSIDVVCAPFADAGYHLTDETFRAEPETCIIASLRRAGVPFVAAAGNGSALFRAPLCEGMGWPAILREAVSVTALTRMADGMLTPDPAHRRLAVGPCRTDLALLPGPPGDTSGAAGTTAGKLASLRRRWPGLSITGLVRRLQWHGRT